MPSRTITLRIGAHDVETTHNPATGSFDEPDVIVKKTYYRVKQMIDPETFEVEVRDAPPGEDEKSIEVVERKGQAASNEARSMLPQRG